MKKLFTRKQFARKLLALIMALVLSAPASYAGILDSVKYYGEGAFYGLTAASYAVTMFYGTLGIKGNISENISAAAALGYTNLWGNNGGIYSADGTPVSGSGGGDGLLNTLKLVEANITFDKMFDIDGLKLKIGRQSYGDKESMVMYFGVRDHLGTGAGTAILGAPSAFDLYVHTGFLSPITSIDAAVAYYENENIKANLMFAALTNNSIFGGSSSNFTISGFDFKYLNIANMIDAQAYFYDIENGALAGSVIARHYDIVGIKGTFHKEIGENAIKASIEGAKSLAGKGILSNDVDRSDTGFIKLDASFNIAKIGITPRLSYGLFGFGKYDVGSVTNYDKRFFSFGNYSPGLIMGYGHAWLSDDQILNLGCDYTLLKKITFIFDWYNSSPVNGDEKAVNEIDFQAKYAFTENIDASIGIAHLFANKSVNDVAYMHAGVSYKF